MNEFKDFIVSPLRCYSIVGDDDEQEWGVQGKHVQENEKEERNVKMESGNVRKVQQKKSSFNRNLSISYPLKPVETLKLREKILKQISVLLWNS